MKQYEFNFESIKKALDTTLIIENLRCRMNSIILILENRQESQIEEDYIDIIYKQYLELEEELSMYTKMFYNSVYNALEKYDNKMQEMTTNIEE